MCAQGQYDRNHVVNLLQFLIDASIYFPQLLQIDQLQSTIDELSDGKFKPIIIDEYCKDFSKLNGVIFCSGQIFLEVKKHIEALEKENKPCHLNVIRVEEIAPFPEQEIMDYLKNNKNSKLKVN